MYQNFEHFLFSALKENAGFRAAIYKMLVSLANRGCAVCLDLVGNNLVVEILLEHLP